MDMERVSLFFVIFVGLNRVLFRTFQDILRSFLWIMAHLLLISCVSVLPKKQYSVKTVILLEQFFYVDPPKEDIFSGH